MERRGVRGGNGVARDSTTDAPSSTGVRGRFLLGYPGNSK